MPFRIAFQTKCVLPLETLRRNAALNANQPKIGKRIPHGRKLAVVGGGPLLLESLDELRAWDGDIWGINMTAQWLNEQGIPATLFSVDPQPFETRVANAVLASCCDPSVFAICDSVLAFDMIETHADGLTGGRSSATRAPGVSFQMGYLDVSFFGCEGSYLERSHVDRNIEDACQFIVRAGGVDYRTCSQFIIQCEELSLLVRTFPDVYRNRSGGLLRAMIEHPDTWEIVAVSAAMKQHLEELNGKQGLYEQPWAA